MKRPLFLLLAGLVLGEAAAILVGWKGVFCSALLFVLLKLRSVRGYILLFWAAFLAGIFVFLAECRPSHMEDILARGSRPGQLEGTITDIRAGMGGTVFMNMEDVVFRDEPENGAGELCLSGSVRVFANEDRTAYLPGDKVCFGGTLSGPETPANPGQFDSRTYYWSNGIRYLFYEEKSKLSQRPAFSFRAAAYLVRERFAGVYDRALGKEYAALLHAMVLGDKSGLSRKEKTLYEENGAAHLLAVSGLHISIIGGRCFRFMRRLGLGYLPSCITGAAVLIFYGCMAGFGHSVVRAVSMYLVYLLAQYAGTEYDIASAMSLSGILMLLEHPYRVLEGGFQMSFVSVFAIGIVLPWVQELREKREKSGGSDQGRARKNKTGKNLMKKCREAFLASLVISGVTAPLIMRIFYEWSPYGFLLNLIVIPCMIPLMAAAILCGFGGLLQERAGRLLGLIPGLILSLFDFLFIKVRNLPGALIVTGCPQIWQMGLWYLAGLTVLLSWYRKRWKPLVMMAGCLFGIWLLKTDDGIRITMLDVGQGECILIRMPDRKTIMIDGGSTTKAKSGEYIIIPALKYYGVDHLDDVIVTHLDEDHISGITEMFALDYPVKTIVMPCLDEPDEAWKSFAAQAKESGSAVKTIRRGDRIVSGEAVFTCLHPAPGIAAEDRNTASVVLHFSYRNFDGLFTGDVDEAGEEMLCGYLGETDSPLLRESLELLKVAHHGSKYSTGERFLNLFDPKTAILSAGKNNRYGHPHPELLERLKKQGTKVWQTNGQGAILLKTDGDRFHISGWRQSR